MPLYIYWGGGAGIKNKTSKINQSSILDIFEANKEFSAFRTHNSCCLALWQDAALPNLFGKIGIFTCSSWPILSFYEEYVKST